MALTQWNAFPEERNSVSVCLLLKVQPHRAFSLFVLLPPASSSRHSPER